MIIIRVRVVNLVIFTKIIISFVLFSDIGGPQLSMHSICEMCSPLIIYQETQLFKVKGYHLVCCCCCFLRDVCKSEGKVT